MLKRLRICSVALTATLFLVSSASAATLIDFRDSDASSVGGVIQYSGGNAVGSGIGIGQVYITGAPANNGFYDVTGNNSGFGELAFNTNTGVITVSGCVADLGVGTGGGGCDPVVLMSGIMASFTANPNNGVVGVVQFAGDDFKHEDLLEAIGLSAGLPFSFFGFDITTPADPNGNATSFSLDVANTFTPVPEPTTMMLLGTGLLAAFRARRRQV